MPKPIRLIGNKEKALVHVAKAQLGLSEEDYRAVLASVGVQSSKDLNYVQFEEVMKRFEAGGFTPKARNRPAKRFRKPPAEDPRAPLLKKIGAILADTGLSHKYADGIAKRMFGVESYSWLTADQLWRVAAALGFYQKKNRKPARGDKR